MGQQQLLLLIICVVLVGLAVVAAFTVLETNYRKDEADGLLERSLAIATQLQVRGQSGGNPAMTWVTNL